MSHPETVSPLERRWKLVPIALQLRLWGRQLPGCHGVGEPARLMGTVAERLVRGMTATAEAEHSSPSQAKGFAFRIDNLEVSFDADRPVVVDCNFCCRHFFS